MNQPTERPALSITGFKVLYLLFQVYTRNPNDYRTLAGLPDGDPAIEQLLEMGLIEEVEGLGQRYRLRVRL